MVECNACLEIQTSGTKESTEITNCDTGEKYKVASVRPITNERGSADLLLMMILTEAPEPPRPSLKAVK